MSYTPTEWKSGDVVTSEKLNHMEDGIAGAGGVMVISQTYDKQNGRNVLDKTWQEIYDAMAQGKLCFNKFDTGDLEGGISAQLISHIFVENGKYIVVIGQTEYSTTTADGYPSIKVIGGVS